MIKMKRNMILLISIIIIGTLFMAKTANAVTYLKVGSYGTEVRTLQTKLQTLGYTVGTVDGVFGERTRYAVVSFQSSHNLAADGIVGPMTIQAIDRDLQRLWTTNGIISTGKSLIGIPYVWGGTTPSGFDCSGYIQYVFNKNGIALPRVASDQYKVGTSVSKSNLKPGDLVFFETYKTGPSHLGIYLGNNQFIHASSGAGKVTISNLTSSYYTSHYIGARRVLK
jgi:cell wall-associated NlpC family hydrolase